MFDRLFQRRRVPEVGTVAALAAFLDERASLVSQKSIVGYCHVKTTLPLSELIREQPFREAFEIARWEGYVAVLADLVVITEGILRPFAGGREAAIGDRLTTLFEAAVARFPPPPGHSVRSDGVVDVADRLARARAAAPRPIAEVALTGAARLFAALPIHERLREPDKPAILANVQFLMVGLAHEFHRRLDHPALVADLLGDGG